MNVVDGGFLNSTHFFLRQWVCVHDLIYKVICCLLCIRFFYIKCCLHSPQIKRMKLFSFLQLKLMVSFCILESAYMYVLQINVTRTQILISGFACGCVQTHKIFELISCLTQAPIPFTHASQILNSFLFVCTRKCQDILLWMTNLLKFTYSSKCKHCHILLPFYR